MPTVYSRLIAHLIWADRRILGALHATPSPDPSAVTIMAHILGAQATWISRIHNVVPPVPIWPTITLDDCKALAETVHAQYERLVASLDDVQLRQTVQYANSTGTIYSTSVEDILTQVCQHSSYHRGQIALLFRQSGETPVNTDYISYSRLVPTS